MVTTLTSHGLIVLVVDLLTKMDIDFVIFVVTRVFFKRILQERFPFLIIIIGRE